jgi:hypothetical protein
MSVGDWAPHRMSPVMLESGGTRAKMNTTLLLVARGVMMQSRGKVGEMIVQPIPGWHECICRSTQQPVV